MATTERIDSPIEMKEAVRIGGYLVIRRCVGRSWRHAIEGTEANWNVGQVREAMAVVGGHCRHNELTV